MATFLMPSKVVKLCFLGKGVIISLVQMASWCFEGPYGRVHSGEGAKKGLPKMEQGQVGAAGA